MFERIKGMTEQFQMMQRMMKDEDFKAFISNPKVQALFQDPEFKDIAKSKDFTQILANPKLASLMRDPEIAALAAKLNPQKFMPKQ
jgi:hypothetical protein